ncbi:unnamed protein product [Ascophyllum nodosum]
MDRRRDIGWSMWSRFRTDFNFDQRCRLWLHSRKQCFSEITNVVFLRKGAYILFLFEPRGGFDPTITQMKGPVEKKRFPSSTRSGTMRPYEVTRNTAAAALWISGSIQQRRVT